jgi:hypothetical protein
MGRLAVLLAENAARRATDAADPTLGERLRRLRSWQGTRLAATYADLAATPRYTAAVTFFLGDLYAGADLAPRDDELRRAAGALERMLPAAALAALEGAIADWCSCRRPAPRCPCLARTGCPARRRVPRR